MSWGESLFILHISLPVFAVSVLGCMQPDPSADSRRYANRIRDGKFSIDGKEYSVPCNNNQGRNSLHGGPDGYGEVSCGLPMLLPLSLFLPLFLAKLMRSKHGK